MGQPNYKIIIRWTFRNHLDNVRDWKEEFPDIEFLYRYLQFQPEKATALGYFDHGGENAKPVSGIGIGKVDAETLKNSRIQNVRLSIWYRGNGVEDEITFKDFRDFVFYLADHPQVAKILQYKIEP